jgi:hypothetical protein
MSQGGWHAYTRLRGDDNRRVAASVLSAEQAMALFPKESAWAKAHPTRLKSSFLLERFLILCDLSVSRSSEVVVIWEISVKSRKEIAMRKKTIVLLNVVLIISIVSIALALKSTQEGGEHSLMITKWEYKSFVTSTESATNKLNKLGSEGWELVSVAGTTFDDVSCFFLKKPKHTSVKD